jgi:hypothetical protein
LRGLAEIHQTGLGGLARLTDICQTILGGLAKLTSAFSRVRAQVCASSGRVAIA